jgi:phosphoglycolate phosphatase-like HAD superfamily hydrolase
MALGTAGSPVPRLRHRWQNESAVKAFGTDFDGVIINLEPEKAAVFGGLLHDRWDADPSQAAAYYLRMGGASRRSKFDHFHGLAFGRPLDAPAYAVIEREFSRHLETTLYPGVRLLPHALDVMAYARSRFDYTFVSSGVPGGEIASLIRSLGMAECFDEVFGTGGAYPSKREHFRAVMARRPERTIFVADGLEDMRIAREFGAIPVGIPTNHAADALTRAGAAVVCDLDCVVAVIGDLLGAGPPLGERGSRL